MVCFKQQCKILCLSYNIFITVMVSSVGKLLSVQIAVLTEPAQYSTYAHAIKVTVDGPREPRSEIGVCLTCIHALPCCYGVTVHVYICIYM